MKGKEKSSPKLGLEHVSFVLVSCIEIEGNSACGASPVTTFSSILTDGETETLSRLQSSQEWELGPGTTPQNVGRANAMAADAMGMYHQPGL